MKVSDLFEKELIKPNSLDVKAREMKLPNVYLPKNRGIGKKTKVSMQKVVIRNTKTGQVFGRRSLIQK